MDRGTPAIQPRSASIPSFTEHDVRDYLSRGVSLGKIEALGQPTITQVAFTTIRELDRACGERYFEANYPADLPICYVELSGTFRVFGPPGLGASPGASISTAFILIDACTGNVFVIGTPSRARWA
jgi:hypothetical protein